MLIDIHTHAFPDKLAENALNGLIFSGGGGIPSTDGTLDGLRKFQKEQGVDISCVMNIAVRPRTMHSVNDFAISSKSDDIIPFGSVHPDAPDFADELERLKENGIKGIKLHPEFQGYYVDDEKMRPVYKKCSELGLVILFHSGGDYSYRPPYHCTPELLKKTLKYIDTTVIAAHFGAFQMGEEVLKHLCGLPLYFDTSCTHGMVPKYIPSDIIEKHGADKIIFGTDTPWSTAFAELRLISTLELSNDELELIKHKNAEKILGL